MTDNAIGAGVLLKRYFGDVSVAELRSLSADDRKELADEAAEEMGYDKTEDGKYVPRE